MCVVWGLGFRLKKLGCNPQLIATRTGMKEVTLISNMVVIPVFSLMKAHEPLNVLQARAPKKLLHRYLMALWGLNIYTKVPGLLGCFRKGVRVEASSRS